MRGHRAERGRGGREVAALALALVFVATACGGGSPEPERPGAPAITEPTRQVARSPHGMVSSAAVPATRVGARVLAEGGNAADAAAATGFALAVSEPAMSGIAGRSSIVVRTPDGQIHGIDGLNEVPAGFREGGAEGYARAAVPGALAALVRLLEDHGTWPLGRVMAPAIRLTEEGFLLTEAQAGRFASAADDLGRHRGARAIFFRDDGSTWEAGERFVQPELARTLQAVADGGVSVFYRGWIADSIHADMERSGGFITRDDLARYEARSAIPVSGSYQGLTVVSNFRPASGHSVIQALHTLEEWSSRARSADPSLEDPAVWAAVLGRAMGMALEDRGRRITGEEAEDARILTSREHARSRAEEIVLAPGREADVDLREAWRPARAPWLPANLVTSAADRESTTHFSVGDAGGMMVSATQSLGPGLGTRVVTPGLGFLYATRLGSEPGSRPSSTISPTLVLGPDGEPLLALGGAGDARIISAVIQVVARRFGQGLSLAEAVDAPRVHPDGDDELIMEEGPERWTDEERRGVRSMGLEDSGRAPGYFGRVHAVEWAEGSLLGVAEPRWEGSAAGPASTPVSTLEGSPR